VAKTMTKIRAIALTLLQDTLRRKVLYLALFALVLVMVSIGRQMVVLQMAKEANEPAYIIQLRTRLPEQVIRLWCNTTLFLAVFLGATGASSEIAAKTIVNVFSRPVERSCYLAGRWIGLLCFLWIFQLMGILVALLVAYYFEVPISPVFWLLSASMLILPLLYSGLSLSLNVVLPPLLAGTGAFLLQFLPSMAEKTIKNPELIVHLPAAAVYYAAPAQMPVDLVHQSFNLELLHPDYALYCQVLGENLLYAVVVFVIAGVVFARRELPMR